MDCYQHPGAASTATCVACARPICGECREEVAGHAMCHACVAAASARLAVEPAAPAPAQMSAPAAPATAGAGATVEAPWMTAAATAEPVLQPAAAPLKEFVRPGLGRRIARGMFWGAVYGQWWTLMLVLSYFFWGATQGSMSLDAGLIADWVRMLIVYGIFGSFSGIVIGGLNANLRTGVAIGVGTGLLLCGLDALAGHDPGSLINLIFYFFTGRFIGAAITWRVQHPVL